MKKYNEATDTIIDWFHSKEWAPFEFQKSVWKAYLSGKSGLIHSATGSGKTYAAWLGAVIEGVHEQAVQNAKPVKPIKNIRKIKKANTLKVLWITPMRALANDILNNLCLPVTDLGLNWKVESRTGDTSIAKRAQQKKNIPDALITTPESLTLMIAQKDSPEYFKGLKCIIVDEWHELIASKRGVMTELALARMRILNPQAKVWGVSATIGNLDIALKALSGAHYDKKKNIIVEGVKDKKIIIDSIIPDKIDTFPWAGHLGIKLLPRVIEEVEKSKTTIVFTNTRSQTETWFKEILEKRPDWAGVLALHHSSLDKDTRTFVENDIRKGNLKCIVSTSSLDLGVDFSPVERVIQIGSPKGVARLMQRAGRSAHNPDGTSRVTCVPTNAFELIEVSAAREAVREKKIEARYPIEKPLDLLTQHLVTIAVGTGFRLEEMFEEVKTTYSYRNLEEKEFLWALDFVIRGGSTLNAYPEFKKVILQGDLYVVENRRIAQRHRMSIGTIVSDAAMVVKYVTGGYIGSVEENFIAKLKPGDKFIFGGRPLEFVKVKDMTAFVKRSVSYKGLIPTWDGGKMPLSSELCEAVRKKVTEAKNGIYSSSEMKALEPIFEFQEKLSSLPAYNELLIEHFQARDGHHVFFYPFEGRLVHEGLLALFAYRISKIKPLSFSLSSTDYGLELSSSDEIPFMEAIKNGLFSPENLYEDIIQSLNVFELAKRQFREIARVSGLIFQGYPGSKKTVRNIQASSSLFYDVFIKYDPENLLLYQANKEVMERQLEQSRLFKTIERIHKSKLIINEIERPSPFCFPILAENFRAKLTTEKFEDRVARMQVEYGTEE